MSERPKKSWNTFIYSGSLIGVGIGALVGGLIGYYAYQGQTVIGIGIGAVSGLILGAIVDGIVFYARKNKR